MIELIGGEAAFETRLRAYLSTRFVQQFEETAQEFDDEERRRKIPRDGGNVVMLGERAGSPQD